MYWTTDGTSAAPEGSLDHAPPSTDFDSTKFCLEVKQNAQMKSENCGAESMCICQAKGEGNIDDVFIDTIVDRIGCV